MNYSAGNLKIIFSSSGDVLTVTMANYYFCFLLKLEVLLFYNTITNWRVKWWSLVWLLSFFCVVSQNFDINYYFYVK